jgi:hypothetical protein
VKLLSEQTDYLKVVKTFMIDIGKGRILTVTKWSTQDDTFNDYDNDWEIAKHDFVLSEDEQDELYDYINGLSLLSVNK